MVTSSPDDITDDVTDNVRTDLRVVDAQRLDFVKGQQNSNQKHLVFFFQW